VKQLLDRLPPWTGPALLVLLLLLALPLGWLLRDLVAGVLTTLYAIILLFGFHARDLPQEELWVLLILLAAVHLVRSLGKGINLSVSRPQPLPPAGPVQSWLDTLALNSEPRRLGRIPLNRLQQLVLAVLAQQERVSLGEMRGRLRSGRLPIDPQLQAFLQTGQSQMAPGRPILQAPELEALISLVEDNNER
jgi:hypothetical protein